jgi:CheY-like chemotaxis protein
LFSIRERLTLLGGRLEIDSAPGRGTRFRLIAPRGSGGAAVAALAPASSGGAVDAVETGHSTRPLRILIVDDHATVRETFRDLLQERPALHVIGMAANGLDGIAAACELRPDVILMDVSMPVMDGIEATRRIRAEIPSSRILGLSTSPRTDGPHAIELAGAAGYFTKGIDTRRLIEQLLLLHAALTIGSAD